MVSNPEFLREGAAITDFKRPDRIVIGAEDERARQDDARRLPSALPQSGADAVHRIVAPQSCIKYAANAFLATKITFINEIADLCERAGADVQDVARGIGLDNRIGPQIPERRPRLRRLLLSQGRLGADEDRPRLRRADAASSRP